MQPHFTPPPRPPDRHLAGTLGFECRELRFAFSAPHGVNARARGGPGSRDADRQARSPRRSRGGRPPAAPHLPRRGLGVGDGETGPRGRGTQTRPSRGLQGLRKLRAPGPARAATPSTDRPSAPLPRNPQVNRKRRGSGNPPRRPPTPPLLRSGAFCASPASFSDQKPSPQVGCKAW